LTFFGGEVIQGFTLAMLFGVVIGVYSTAFIAAPILIYLGVRTQTVEGRSGARAEAEAS
jgi:preprotein translocase subunit SecF